MEVYMQSWLRTVHSNSLCRLMGWTIHQNKFNEGSVLVLNRQEENTANPRFVRITKNDVNDTLSLTNEGFRGMGIKKGLRYDFSVLCRQQTPGLKLHIELLNAAGMLLAVQLYLPQLQAMNGKKR